ncbi:MAG: metal ABC transporter ATP-binding protein [Actinomycetota bacterium]|nr:metal ABC transporter ATP-binding protein [Actinomycetota bacterium]
MTQPEALPPVPVVRLVGAGFGYEGVVAARADLVVQAGEVVALLGANGSGKSTIIKGMLGLIDHLGGEVEWFGRPMASFRERWRVGYVPQRELAASPVPATLDEVVRSGRVARIGLLGRYRAADRRAVARAIRTVGLDERRRTPVRQLSGGQQRRALVARALAGDAEVLVLDEPFAGVDHESQEALAATFRDLAANGVTLIVVLHEVGPLEGVVTRSVCIDNGEVLYDGPPGQRPASMPDDPDPHGGHDHHHSGDHEQRPRLGLLP